MSENKNNSSKNESSKDKVDLFPIFRTMYDLVLDFEHAHGQFPKLHKFTVGKRISTSLIVALENIIAAIVSEDRRIQALSSSVVELEKTRILIRLSHDLKAIDTKRYERFSLLVVSALEQVAALLKAARKHSDK